jgi:SAM-dependent methyltransferase
MGVGNYKEIDGIKIFNDDAQQDHQDYNAKGLNNLFAQEEKHFWFIARKEFIFNHMSHYVSKVSKVIEIGAGTGNVSRYLKHNGYANICVGEMHLNGLKYAKGYGIENCYQFDLLRAPFKNEFDAVCMFDVLEHIENDTLALQNVHKMLKENGNIILTVPAHMWLWNRDDSIAGHKIRYTKKDLEERLKENGFDIVFSRYFFITIVPLLFLRRLLNKDPRHDVINEEHDKDISISPILNAILLLTARIENKINRYLPNVFGGSLFIIAKRS